MASPGFADTKKRGKILNTISVKYNDGKYQRLDEMIGHLELADVAELTCPCSDYKKTKPGRAPWCGHLTDVYQQGKDVIEGEEFHARQSVTLFQYPGVTAWVELDPPSIPHSYRVVRPLARRRGAPVDTVYKDTVLGVLTPHCGRQVMRHYLADFVSSVDWTSLRCNADWHERGSLPWEDEHSIGFNPRDKVHVASLVDLLWTGQCRRCNEDDGVPDV